MTTVTAVELRRPDVPRPLGIATAPVVGGTLSFVLLTGAVFWYQLQQIRPGDASPRWSDLHWGYLAAAILCVPLETLAAAWRTRLVAGVLHPRLRYWTCLQAEWVNVALNLLTPAHLGGGPVRSTSWGARASRPGPRSPSASWDSWAQWLPSWGWVSTRWRRPLRTPEGCSSRGAWARWAWSRRGCWQPGSGPMASAPVWDA